MERLKATQQGPLAAKHAVEFIDKVVYGQANKQQMTGSCMACSKTVKSTGSSRQLQHILQCPLIPKEVAKEFQVLKAAWP